MLKLPPQFWQRMLTIVMLFAMVGSFFAIPVQADVTSYKQDCSTNSIVAGCQPPKISDIQTLVVKVLTAAWSLGAVAFFALLLYNGAIYLIGSLEESEYILGVSIKDVQKRMTQWGIGFFMFFLSYPLMNTILGIMVNNTDCYAELREPGFTFFFPTVCNEVEINDAVVNAVKTNIQIIPEIKMSCSNYDLSKDFTSLVGSVSGQVYCVSNCGLLYDTMTLFPVYKQTEYVYCDCSKKISDIANICIGTVDSLD